MNNFLILNLQSTLSLVVFAMIARWYIVPRLSKLNLTDALIPLLLIHAFRYTPMTLLVDGQIANEVPSEVANAVAYGDLAAAILAILAILFLKFKFPGAVLLAWIFNIVGILDIVNALRVGVGAKLYEYALGFNWYILNYYVPLLIVTHVVMVYWLVKKKE
ncbi:MAG: hypothetical protein ACR2MX_10735 [Cyclobacteriaceae bacterium]